MWPVISYFETGTVLTPNHVHSALMGVFGMLGVSFIVFALGGFRRTTPYPFPKAPDARRPDLRFPRGPCR